MFEFAKEYGLNSLNPSAVRPEFHHFLWVDIETTGLSLHEDVLLEVGAVLTDAEGYVSAEPVHTLIGYTSEADRQDEKNAFENMSAYVREMHETSGLLAEREADETVLRTPQALLRMLVDYLQQSGVTDPKQIDIAGSSVKFDYYMLGEWIPDFIEPSSSVSINYRDINVSTLKELCRKLNPEMYAKLERTIKPMKKHRSIPDLADSLREYYFYVDNFLWLPPLAGSIH